MSQVSQIDSKISIAKKQLIRSELPMIIAIILFLI